MLDALETGIRGNGRNGRCCWGGGATGSGSIGGMLDDLGVSSDSVRSSGSTAEYAGRTVALGATLVVEAASGSGAFDDLNVSSDSVRSSGSTAEYAGRAVAMEAALVVEALDDERRKKNLLRVGIAEDPASLGICCWGGTTGSGSLGGTFDDLGVSSDSVRSSGSTAEYAGTLVVEAASDSRIFDDLGASPDPVCCSGGTSEYSGRVVVMEATLVVEALDDGRRKKNLLRVGTAEGPASLGIF
jgi:hypothetical protein